MPLYTGREPGPVSRRTLRRFLLIAGGYAAAWAAGALAVWWHDRSLSATDRQAMSGMLAFGDTVLLFAVAAPLAILPTLFLFSQLRNARRFWRVHATGSLLLSLTGVIEAFLFLAPIRFSNSILASLSSFSPIRVLAAPICLLVYAPGLLSVAAPNRKITLTACFLEVCTLGSFLVWLLQHRTGMVR